MKQYLGVKLISAEPMTQGEQWAESHNGISCCEPNNDREGYKVVYEDGYTSWSPKEVFEKAYHEVGDISVGAIAKRIAVCASSSPTKSRMVEELGQLVARVEKLDAFITGEVFKTLDPKMQNLLTLQLNSMKLYLSVLIERFEKME